MLFQTCKTQNEDIKKLCIVVYRIKLNGVHLLKHSAPQNIFLIN